MPASYLPIPLLHLVPQSPYIPKLTTNRRRLQVNTSDPQLEAAGYSPSALQSKPPYQALASIQSQEASIRGSEYRPVLGSSENHQAISIRSNLHTLWRIERQPHGLPMESRSRYAVGKSYRELPKDC